MDIDILMEGIKGITLFLGLIVLVVFLLCIALCIMYVVISVAMKVTDRLEASVEKNKPTQTKYMDTTDMEPNFPTDPLDSI
jgi:uncharacterized membrane protein